MVGAAGTCHSLGVTKLRPVVSVLLSSALLGACGGGDDATSTGDDVVGSVWQLTELDGEAVPEGVTPTLEFDGTRIAGSSGCNTYGADATFDDGAVTVSPQIISTMMACEPPASDVEFSFLQVLPTVDGFAVDGDTLSLSTDGESVMVFTSSA